MKRIIGIAEVEGGALHLAVFKIKGKHVSLVTEELLEPGEQSRFPGLEVWLIVRVQDRSIRYVTLPKAAKRHARGMAMLQASPRLLEEPEAYAHDALVKPVGDELGALVVAIPLSKAHAWEKRLEEAGLVLVSFAVEPLFYPLLRPPRPGKIMFCMPTPQGSLALIGCCNGTPVCWTTIRDQSRIPAGGGEDLLVREYFCPHPEAFKPDKILAGEPEIEPRLVGYLAAAHLAAMSPRPWEGRSLLTFSEFLQREQSQPATLESIIKCVAVWVVVAGLLLLAGIAHVRKTERKADALKRTVDDMQVFARQSALAGQEVRRLVKLRNGLREYTLDKVMALDIVRQLQEALPLRVKVGSMRFDAASGLQVECIAEKEPDILIMLDHVRNLKIVKSLRLVFAEARDDGAFHFRIECTLRKDRGS